MPRASRAGAAEARRRRGRHRLRADPAYGRDQELENDRLELMADAGVRPEVAMTLRRRSARRVRRTAAFLATHPRPSEVNEAMLPKLPARDGEVGGGRSRA